MISLHTAIKELQDEAENPDSIFNRSGAGKKKELAVLVQNCNGVLQKLNSLIIKYKSLGTKTKRTWDRLKWGTENLADIREKIMSHTSSLTLFLTTLGTGSLGRIEKRLDEIYEEVRAGKREATILTIPDNDDEEAELHWDMFKRELVDDGFTKVELERNKNWIKAKLAGLIESGGAHEKPVQERAGNITPPFIGPRPIEGVQSQKHAAFQATVEEEDENEDEDEDHSEGPSEKAENQGAIPIHPEPENNSDKEKETQRDGKGRMGWPMRTSFLDGFRTMESARVSISDESEASVGSDESDSDGTCLPTDSISNVSINFANVPSIRDIRPSNPTPPAVTKSPRVILELPIKPGLKKGSKLKFKTCQL